MNKTALQAYGDTVTKEAEVNLQEFHEYESLTKKFSVTSEGGYVEAADLVKEVKRKYAEVKEQQDTAVNPLKAVVKTIEGWFKPALLSLVATEGNLKTAMLAYRTREEVKKRELAEKAQAETNAGNHKLAMELAQSVAEPLARVEGVGTVQRWKARVTDRNLVPREYMIIDESRLNAVARAQKGQYNIPGVEFYVEESLSVRK